MKGSLILYSVLLLSLTACQYLPSYHPTDKANLITDEGGQLMSYGAKFANEYNSVATETCTKYKQFYQEGDWRAGWILALQVTDTKKTHCLNSKEAIQILTRLETENKINSNLMWLTNVHLSWLDGQEQQAKKLRLLKRSISKKKAQLIELKKENVDLVEKLEALKAIETSINQ